jgi:hypothetical protein
MKHKFWLVFAVIQFTGLAAALEASWLQEPLALMVSAAALLPGSLAAIGLMTHLKVAANLPFWLLGAISVTVNVLLFALMLFPLARFRKQR